MGQPNKHILSETKEGHFFKSDRPTMVARSSSSACGHDGGAFDLSGVTPSATAALRICGGLHIRRRKRDLLLQEPQLPRLSRA